MERRFETAKPRAEQNAPARRYITADHSEIRLERRNEGELPKIVGYAARFYDGTPGTEFRIFDDLIERIMPGAFDRAIREDDVRGLFNHDMNAVLGRTTSQTLTLSVDDKGLRYEIDPPDTQLARDLVTSIERGDITGSSFAFFVRKQVFREESDDDGRREIREIEEVELVDVSPVTFPAYEATTTGVRCADDADEAKAAREQFRDARRTVARRRREARLREIELDQIGSGN